MFPTSSAKAACEKDEREYQEEDEAWLLSGHKFLGRRVATEHDGKGRQAGKLTAIGTITGTAITTTMTIALIPTITTTITKASSAAIRPPNKKQRLRPLFFYFPLI